MKFKGKEFKRLARRVREISPHIPKEKQEKMSNKYAIIIGNTEYTDPGLAQLTRAYEPKEGYCSLKIVYDWGRS